MLEAGLANHGDVMLELKAQKGTLETALALHLGHKTVEIVSIMQRGRRLHADAVHMQNFEVRYVAKEATGNANSGSVMQTLQDALSQAGSALALKTAVAQWGWLAQPTATQHQESGSDDDRLVAYIAIGAGCLVSALAAVGVFILCRRNRRQLDFNPTVDVMGKVISDDLEKNEKMAAQEFDAKPVGDNEKDEDMDDVETQSVSTGTPGSEEEVHSEDVNSEGNAVTPEVSVALDPESSRTEL
jgi:hypothetical protein